MPKKGKRFQEALRKFDKSATYSVREGFELVRSLATAKFDETVEVAFRLGIDARKADQNVRGTVSLPHGVGKDIRVAVFAQGEPAEKAREAGADFVGSDELVEQVQGGMFDFDVAIASPDMMSKVGKLGKLLGPRGLMPNPKSGTVTPNVGDAVKEFKAGRTEYRNDRYGNVHLGLGKASFEVDKLLDNYVAALEELQRAKPASAKGRYVRGITLSSTMSPGVAIDPHNPLPEVLA